MSDDRSPLERQRIDALAGALADHLEPGELDDLLGRLSSAGGSAREMILGLGLLVAERSAKATAEYLRQAPLLIGRLEAEEWGAWVGVGLNIAARSAVAAVRYFRESPATLAEVEPSALRRAVCACANRFAEQDAGLALEVVRQAPAVVRLLPDDAVGRRLELLQRWALAGEQLAQQDTILASEYFKQSAQLLLHLPAASLGDWAGLGSTLVQPNRLGKPDYMPALEFFRLSPEWLGLLTPPEARSRLLQFVRRLTDESPDRRVRLLRETPHWLQAIPSAEQRLWLLEQAIELSVLSPEAAMAVLERGGELMKRFFLRAPQLEEMRRGAAGQPGHAVEAAGAWRRRLADWISYGRELLLRSPDAGIAYFRLESSASEQRLDQVAGGLSLRSVARTLTLFAGGLSGQALTIKPTAEAESADATRLPDAVPFRQGGTIFLPPFVSEFGSPDDNFRYYRVMTAHQAAQVEFASFQANSDATAAIARTIPDDGRAGRSRPVPMTSSALTASADGLFAQLAFPLLARDLWKVAEGGRIDARLREAYPGLRRDLDLVVTYTLSRRPSLRPIETTVGGIPTTNEPSVAEQIMEWLLQLSMAGRTLEPIPAGLQPLIDQLCGLLARAQRPGATAADSLQVACDGYTLLVRRLTGQMDRLKERTAPTVQAGANPLGAAGESIGASTLADYRALTTPQYRGRQGQEQAADEPLSAQRPDVAQSAGSPSMAGTPGRAGVATTAAGVAGSASSDKAESAVTGARREADGVAADGPSSPAMFRYPEWDEAAQDYRLAWCTVREQPLPLREAADTGQTFTEQTLTHYYGQRLLLRRMFERMKPDRLRRLKRQEQGEEIDLDAAIEAAIDRRAGRSPSEKLYIQRDRRERDVAVALLVDVSGSTGKLLGGTGAGVQGRESGFSGERSAESRSIVQVEKESLLLLAEAVHAVGDALAIYAYSGDGRDQVDFFLVKEFDEPYTRSVGERIGLMTAMAQNRDGAAIRHAVSKLMRREAKTRLLIVLSDSRPFDRDYEGAYALADTRRALEEAQRHRIQTFCITVDHQADHYVAGLFAPGRYAIIDDVCWLPVRLPRIYQRITT